MVLRNLSDCPQDGYIFLRFLGNGGSSKNLGKARPRRGLHGTLGLHQPPGPIAPGELVERFLLVASNGVEWWWWLRVASIGVKLWTQVVQSETEKDKMVRENERERSLTSSLRPSLCFESWLLLTGCAHGTALDMVGLSRLTAEVDVDVAAGGSVPRTNGTG